MYLKCIKYNGQSFNTAYVKKMLLFYSFLTLEVAVGAIVRLAAVKIGNRHAPLRKQCCSYVLYITL